MTWEDKIRQLLDLDNAFADPFRSGEILYHYTSAEGFRGIVTNHEIWLTNTAFVNDTTECRAFWELGKGDVFGADSLPNKHVVECWERAKEMRVEDNNYYIASFSKAKDQLQQYRSYGSVCVGFRASELMKAGFHLYDCVYDVSEVRKWIREKSIIKEWDGNCLDDQTRGLRHLAFCLRLG